MAEWISKKYLDDEWYSLFEINKGKRIICFGAGTALYTIPEFLPEGVTIEYYIDSNYEKWKNNFANMEVRNPEVVKSEKKGNFIILIAGQHTISMKEQLNSYGLTENIDYIDIYGKYEKAMRLGKSDYQTGEFIKFIQRTKFKDNKSKDKKIGVVVTCTFLAPISYDIALYLLLRNEGYDAELIVDDIYSNENKSIYEGITEDMKLLLKKVIDVIKCRIPDTVVRYISQYQKEELDSEDLEILDDAVQANAIWQRSRKIDRIMSLSEKEWYDSFYDIYRNNLGYIKAFFRHNRYDSINIFTGIHGQRYFYPYAAKKYKVRVSTYDNGLWCSDGACSHQYDIPKVVLNKLFTKKEEEEIVKLSKEHFTVRQKATYKDKNIASSYQPIEKTIELSSKPPYCDVIIPLNVMWDAAAIGSNRIFKSEKEWLIETLKFILDETYAEVMIREHPAAAKALEHYNHDSYKELIDRHFPDQDRIIFVDYNMQINTYDYIEHSKVVLPLTSTVGIEAVLLGKTVVTHSTVYYGDLDFSKKAMDKQEYFDAIKSGLKEGAPDCANERQGTINSAWITYYLLMNQILRSGFKETSPEWLLGDFKDISEDNEVKKIVRLVADGIPMSYMNVKEKLDASKN